MLTIAAEVVGTSAPRHVQVVVAGLAAGDAYEVRGLTDTPGGGFSWPVRAGRGTFDGGSQLLLHDAHAPVNRRVWYQVVVGDVSAVSAPVVVDYAGRYVLQALDGRRSVTFKWLDNNDPREFRTRSAVFPVPGRDTPVVRFDRASGEDGELWLSTTRDESKALRELVRVGAPLLVRTDGAVRDLAPVEFIHVLGCRNELSGAGVADRHWSLAFTVISDPDPDALVAPSTWDDFDAAYEGLTGADFDAEWADGTGDVFDREDWAVRSQLAVSGFGFGGTPYGESPYGI